MRAAEDIDDYLADPTGAHVVMPHGLVFCASPALWGFALWGRPSAEDVAAILPLIHLELEPSVPPHVSMVDLRRIEDADPSAFHVLARYLQENTEAIGEKHTRVALVRPTGYLGMIVAGFHDVVRGRYPVSVFEELAEAAAWAGDPGLADRLGPVIEEASLGPAAVVALRRWLDENVAGATLESAARSIARAPRSLQRDLREAGSSFQRELDAARVRRAKRLLARTDTPLTEIAYDVGCASPQHFSVLFRRLSGVAPSAWRALHRR